MERKILRPGEKIPVLLTYEERDLIHDETFFDEDFAALALVVGDRLQVNMTPAELEDLVGHVAAASNHAKKKTVEKKLDRLWEKLEDLLSPYEEDI